MDIALARTFLEIAASGSFAAAAERLNLTQTAISARIRALEEQLGRRLFIRNRTGARLTEAGRLFHPHAIALVQGWERARREVGLPPGRADRVAIGGQFSLWSPLMADLLLWMRRESPELAVRLEVDAADRLLGRVQDGTLDLAVLYSPPPRPGLVLELIAEEKLILVTTDPGGRLLADDYIYVDWGSPFAESHEAAFPQLANATLSVSLGPLALSHMLAVGGSGYYRSAIARPYLETGQLQRIEAAPEFSYSIYVAYASKSAGPVMDRVRSGLRLCAAAPSSRTERPQGAQIRDPAAPP
jgi:DNA-binding transcriptional LysR family regulator